MLLAEYLDEEVRAAVDHLRLLVVVGHGVHHAEELRDPPTRGGARQMPPRR
jgi:hypothetical protein